MFSVTTLNENDLDVMCIYRIWFGNKFYIGSTSNSYNRMIGHYKFIMEGLSGEWLSASKGNPDCLNVNFNAHRTINGVIVRPNGCCAIKKLGKYIYNTYL